jgi:Xaa-Pro aminopeptidase
MESLDEMKKVQQLAYEGAIAVRKQLKVGMTEKEAAALLEKFFQDKGHHTFFHRPFAWFGDRTNFTNFKRPSAPKRGQLLPHLGVEFLPTDRKLEEGMAVTLDVAPSVNGLACDIGYSFSFGDNADVTKARKSLLELREIIVTGAKNKLPIKEIYRLVERRIIEQGYRNCHDLYPLGVLGHKIGKLPLMKLPRISIMGFHPQAYAYLIKEIVRGSALMTEDETRPMSPGLWAVEPHIGSEKFGVKFEEILVVTENDAFWLDDQLPHIQEIKG